MGRWFAICLIFLVACAVPRSHSGFSLVNKGEDGEQAEFASSQDLLVAGLVSEGLNYANSGRLFDAEVRLRQARYLEPTNDRIAFNLAVIINQSDQSEEALRLMQPLLSKEPNNANYLQAVADMYVSEGDYERAKETLKQAFTIFKAANNLPRSALVARSISNIAFGVGSEQEALCYSYEAATLAPNTTQFGLHARLLVALNLSSSAEGFITARRALGTDVLSQHSLALARYAQGKVAEALEAEEAALARVSQAPELSQEVTAAWWLMKKKTPDPEASESTKEKMDEMTKDVVEFSDKGPYELVMWPPQLRRDLVLTVAQNRGLQK